MVKTWCAIAAAGGMLVFAACGASTMPAPPALVGPTWNLTAIGAETISLERPATIEFSADGNAGGIGACNLWFASYARVGGSLRIGDVGSTNMGCPVAWEELDDRYFATLESITDWAIRADGRLVLGIESTPALTYLVDQ
jgi:heat shock protein HslJ